MADEPGRIHILESQFFAFTRQHQWAYLEKSKSGGFFRAARQLDRELDFHRAPERVFPDAHELIKHCRQREDSIMLENRGKAYDADAGPAESVIDRMVVHRIRRTQQVECSIRRRRIQSKSHLSQLAGRIVFALHVIKIQRPESSLRVREYVLHR